MAERRGEDLLEVGMFAVLWSGDPAKGAGTAGQELASTDPHAAKCRTPDGALGAHAG